MLFDSSVRKEVARTFGATLVVILTIVLAMMLIRTLGLAASGSFAPQDVVLVMGYTALGQLPTMLSLSLFVAIVISLGRMYRDSEMAIWFSSGLGLAAFVRPVVRVGWPVLVVTTLLVLFAWPWANRQLAEMRTRYEQRSDVLRVTPGAFQSSADGSRVFFIERAGEQAGVGRNVFLVDRRDGRESVTTASSGRLVSEGDRRILVLDQGYRHELTAATGVRTRVYFDEYRIEVDLDKAAAVQSRAPKQMASKDLLQAASPAQQGELAWRLGLALSAANMMLMGIGTAATSPRRASNWNLLFALLAFVLYFNLINLTQAWVAAERLSLGAALLALHGGVFLAAWLLIRWRDVGTVWRMPWQAQALRSGASA